MNDPSNPDHDLDSNPEDSTRIFMPRPVTETSSGPLSEAPAPDDEQTVPPFSDIPQPVPVTPVAATPAAPPTPAPSSAPRSTRMLPGQVLGHTYEIEAHLARGGMGEVYRARHIELGTLHAIKVILPELAEDPKIISLFQEEARKLSKVRNDAVVAYEGLFRDENGVRYLVMEFVDGTSLSRIIRNGPLSVEAVRQLRDRCAMGLAAAHEKRIFHRDIAPDNILLVNGQPELAKIIDFGIAKSADPGEKTLIGQDFAGKYSYVSPEQLGLYGGAVDGRSDIYSLGLVLVAAAAGKALDMGGSPATVVEARRGVPDLSSIPEELRAELAPLLEPNPADRPQSMGQLPGSRLWQDASGGPAAVGNRSQPSARPGQQTSPGKKSAEAPKSAGKPGVALIAGIAAFLVVVAGGAYFLLSGGKPTQTADTAINATPAPTRPAPATQLPPAAPAPSVSLPAIQAALNGFPCAHLSASAPDGANVSIAGFVGTAEDLQRLPQAAQNAGAPTANIAAVKIFQKPLCNVGKLLEENAITASSRPVIAFDNASRLYKDGSLIAITTTAPAEAGGYLYVDEFATDGSVVHMLPSPEVTANHISAGGSMTIGSLSQTPKPNESRFAVAPPYGPTMIVAMITSKPIFNRARPQQEDAAEYLKEINRRLMLDTPAAQTSLVAGGYEVFDIEP